MQLLTVMGLTCPMPLAISCGVRMLNLALPPTALPSPLFTPSRSILANKEPFKGGDWRKTPYIPR